MSLKKAVLKTIKYTKSFGARLSLNELKERLISKKSYSGKEIEEIVKMAEIGRWMSEKKGKNKKLEMARNLTEKYLWGFEDILMVGVTGSVAAGRPKKNDDIDLLIITRKKRLWLTRLKVEWLLRQKKISHRRYGVKEKRNDFCFNLWLDRSELKLPKNKEGLQNAMDMVMMKVILNREGAYEEFIRKNYWAKRYVATGYSKLKIKGKKSEIKNNERKCWDDWLNWGAFWGQYIYMRPKMRGEVVNFHQAFFHPVV